MRLLTMLQVLFSPASAAYLTLFIFTTLAADTLLQKPWVISHMYLRCLLDNATHGAVAALSWAAVISFSWQIGQLVEVVICGLLACMIDLDHFYEAGSLQLKDALNLQRRPLCHMTSLLPVVLLGVVILKRLLQCHLVSNLAVIMLISVLTHHLRDGIRRGLWLAPFGHTPPLPYILYICLVVLLVYITRTYLLHKDNILSNDIKGTLSPEHPSVLK